MSAINSFTPISIINENNNNNANNSKSYNDLINFGSIRKQFARIIPNYINYKNIKIGLNMSSIEEYKKLKQEIISIEESILLLKEKKQKKLDQIEELRHLMRKEGQKKILYNDNKQNKNNYWAREKNDSKRFGCDKQERKGSNGNCKSSDETEAGCSIPPTNSGLSDNCADEEGLQKDDKYSAYRNFSNNNSSSFMCIIDESNDVGEVMHKEMHEEEFMQHMDN